ncbi:MAG: hypothetical protein OEV94_07655 [Deltaproteobacteria bacterium]|nr:hypothetical protein [Deltaproteobacteria bacterium]
MTHVQARPLRWMTALGVFLFLVLGTGWSQGAEPAPSPDRARFAGTYKIDEWKSREHRGMYHFFYLDPDGTFLLAASWKEFESSKIAGTWSLVGGRVELQGVADVQTNRGSWRVDFHRSFTVETQTPAPVLKPIPEKNRYGMMGWPSTFTLVSPKPEPNLPDGSIPADRKEIGKLIAKIQKG